MMVQGNGPSEQSVSAQLMPAAVGLLSVVAVPLSPSWPMLPSGWHIQSPPHCPPRAAIWVMGPHCVSCSGLGGATEGRWASGSGWRGVCPVGWAPGVSRALRPLAAPRAPWEEADGTVSSAYAQASQNQPSVPRNRGAAPPSSWWGSGLASLGAR